MAQIESPRFDLVEFFVKMPQALPLYEALEKRVLEELGPVNIKAQKTQIAFANAHNFAFVWLPMRKIKGRPACYIIVSFGLGQRVASPRIEGASEPYPHRFTHHVLVASPADIDAQLLGWLREARDFSACKRG